VIHRPELKDGAAPGPEALGGGWVGGQSGEEQASRQERTQEGRTGEHGEAPGGWGMLLAGAGQGKGWRCTKYINILFYGKAEMA